MGEHEEAEVRETSRTDAEPEGRVRVAARKRVEKRRGLEGALVAYVVVNAGLIAIWALAGGGYFWPGWIIGLWGIGMVIGFWDYLRKPVTDADVDAEVRKMRAKGW